MNTHGIGIPVSYPVILDSTSGHLIISDASENLVFESFDIPTSAGHYNLSGYYIHLDEKPRRLHRFFARVLLGWGWCDVE